MSDAKGKFLPLPTPETAFWWESCREQRLLVQHCADCGAYQFYPRASCSSCSGSSLGWAEAAGTGTVTTFTICRVPVAEAYAEDVPYVVALVKLEEGPTMMSNIVGCDPESVAIGMPVEVVFEPRSAEISLPQFRPRARRSGR
jgi:uncharacterized OB-fold protein